MTVDLITNKDLQNLKEEILGEIKNLFAIQFQAATTPEFLKAENVREILKCSDGKLETLRKSGKLPFKKLQGTIYYLKQDVLKLFDAE